MAYGLIYNLNFASNLDGNRKHRLSIYKDGHTPTITTSDNNIIGTAEPVVLIWDNDDSIYNNVMGSRLEMNLLSDDTKQIEMDDILSSTEQGKYQVRFFIENGSGTLVEYWRGYISNATFEQRISSTPVVYRIIATDLLTTLRNSLVADNPDVIDAQPTVMKHFSKVFEVLPATSGVKINTDFQIEPYKAGVTNVFTDLNEVQWLFGYGRNFELLSDNVDGYLRNTLKAFNARVFLANDYWYIISNCRYADAPTFDTYNTSGTFVSSSSANIVKTIPTDLKPINNDLTIRYETPVDVVEVTTNRNNFVTDLQDVGLIRTDDYFNLTPYGNFETKPSGILVNAYYSDDFSVIATAQVKTGNYAIKTATFNTSGTPTDKIFDTGFVGDFQYENDTLADDFFFYCSFYLENTDEDENNTTLYYSFVKEVSATPDGASPTYYYSTGIAWLSYTSESSIAKLPFSKTDAGENTWVDVTDRLSGENNSNYVRYRFILWEPTVTTGTLGGVTIIHFDKAYIGRYNKEDYHTPIKTLHTISGSTRKNSKLSYDVDMFYPIVRFTDFKSSTITPSYTLGINKYNFLLAQQILNDNREHIKRYSVTVVPTDFNDILYPYHKIDISFGDFTTDTSCIIDRLIYSAKSGSYSLEFHKTNQDTNITITTSNIGSVQ
jgi:hypothetical protein